MATAEKRQQSIRDHDAEVASVCTLCAAGCGMTLIVRDGRIVDVWGDAEHPLSKGSLCALGSAAAKLAASPKRLLAPRLRERGTGQRRSLSWQQALDLLAARFAAAAALPPLLAQGRNTAWDSAHCAARLAAAAGCDRVYSGRVPDPQVEAFQAASPLPHDWPRARLILLLGADPARTEPITMGWIVNARLTGTRVLAAGAPGTIGAATAAKADRLLTLRPGAEAALLLALAQALAPSERGDLGLLREVAADADDWLAACATAEPGALAQACGVDTTTLAEVAALLAHAYPLLIIVDPDGLGGDAAQSALTLRAAAALVTTLGSIGVPGGGLVILGGDGAPLPANARREPEPGRRSLLLWEPGSLPSRRDRDWGRRLAAQADFVVRIAAFEDGEEEGGEEWAGGAADLLLPAALWLEHAGVTSRTTARCLQWHRQVLSPPGLARPAAWIWAALAARLGLAAHLPWLRGDSEMDCAAMAACFLGEATATAAISVAALAAPPSGGVLWPCATGQVPVFEADATLRGAWRPWQRKRGWPGQARGFLRFGVQAEAVRAMLALWRQPGQAPVLPERRGCASFDLPPGAWPWIEALAR